MADFRILWSTLFKLNWQFGLFLILLFGIPRFIIVLSANETGNYNFTSIIFVLMILVPFVLLTKQGRQLIGIARSKSF